MTLTVETGSGSSTSESYQSVAGYKTWADARGYTYGTDAEIEQAARRATAYVDAKYRTSFPGSRTNARDQALEWPRADATDVAGNTIASTAIPAEIVAATNEGIKRELASPGSLAPDIKAGGGVVSRVKAGSTEVEFAVNGSSQATFEAIKHALSGLITIRSAYVGTIVRG